MSQDEKIAELQDRLKRYEENGPAKLYYAMNRKLNEMADILNANSLKDINIDDPKDKSFDRVFKLLEKSETVGASVKALGEYAGITQNESADVARKPFNDRIAESRS